MRWVDGGTLYGKDRAQTSPSRLSAHFYKLNCPNPYRRFADTTQPRWNSLVGQTMAQWSTLDSPWICKRCSPTSTEWKPSNGIPVAWVPMTRRGLVSLSRGSIRATTYGFASWQSRLRMKSLAFNSLPAHPHEGNATTTRRIAWQVRAVGCVPVCQTGVAQFIRLCSWSPLV
jgi:hypothetical protein